MTAGVDLFTRSAYPSFVHAFDIVYVGQALIGLEVVQAASGPQSALQKLRPSEYVPGVQWFDSTDRCLALCRDKSAG